MSKAAELAAQRAHAARLRAEQEAPGLDGPQSVIPTDDQAQKERAALAQLDAHAVDGDVGVSAPAPSHAPSMPAVEAPQAAQASADTASQAQAETQAEAPVDPIEVLSSMPNGPTKQFLMGLKAQWPEIYFLPLADQEVYVYRYLNNQEWKQQLLANQRLIENQEALRDAVVQRCVLWPQLSPEQWAAKQAGLRDLLYEVVMKSSYFIEPEQAMALVMRL